MKTLYVISGVTGMTGNELVRQLLNQSQDEVEIIGFDNYYKYRILSLVFYLLYNMKSRKKLKKSNFPGLSGLLFLPFSDTIIMLY